MENTENQNGANALEGVNRDIEKAWALFCADKKTTFIVAQISPASRVAIGDYFGLSRGEDGIGKVAAVLRGLGVDAVVDTAIAEDAVAILETKKLLACKRNGANKPLFASRCDAFVKYAKENYPDACVSQLPATATVCGLLLKEFYREQAGKCVRVIAVEPCAEKKNAQGVDLVLTTEELVSILAETEVNLRLSKKDGLDAPFGVSSGSGYICGMSGGVADSIARCLSADKSQEAIRKFAYSGLYGDKKRREATLKIDGETWKFAVVCGMKAAEELLKDIENGAAYDYVEVMACEGGCVGGDGQVCVVGENESVAQAAKLRGQGLKYVEAKRAAKAADMSAAATMLARAWTDMERRLPIEEEPIDWDALFAAMAVQIIKELAAENEDETEEVLEEIAEKVVAEETASKEPVAEDNAGEDVISEAAGSENIPEIAEENVAEEEAETACEAVQAAEEEIAVAQETAEQETAEQAVEEPIAAIEEKIVEEEIAVAENNAVAEDSAAECVDEVEEEAFGEKPAEEESADEAEKKDPYRTRLSGRDRRKLKRMKKNGK